MLNHIFAMFVLLSQTAMQATIKDLLTQTVYSMQTIIEGDYGEWKTPEYPIEDYFACGASLQREGDVMAGDDTSANGLKLKLCKA